MYIFKITFKHHISNSWPILIYLIGFSLFPFFMTLKFGKEDAIFFTNMGIVCFLLFFIPQLIIHLNYYLINKGEMFFYDPGNKRITLERMGISNTFNLDDIAFIERIKSYPLAENRLQWFPWDSYNYSIINLKSGQRFVITSLLVPNLEIPIGSNKIKLKKTFYGLVSLDSIDKDERDNETSIPKVFLNKVKNSTDKELEKIISSDLGQYDKNFIAAAKKELMERKDK